MEQQDFPNPRLIAQLELLRETPLRDPHAAAATRTAFLIEARNAAHGVSEQPFRRLNRWMAAITTFLAASRKDRLPMLKTAVALTVVLGLAFGGATMAAAQASMPDSALYEIKLWSEDTLMSISADQEAQFQLELSFTARRMEEIQTMLQQGETSSESVAVRLQTQLQHALRLAANMPDEQAAAAFLQIQTQLQQHERAMLQMQLGEDADPALLQIREQVRMMLQQQIRLCDVGLADPDQLREQLRLREQNQLHQPLQEGEQDQNQTSEQNRQQNQDQNQDGEPSQEQPGEMEQEQHQNQNRDQNQNQNQYGSDDETPAPNPDEDPASSEGNGPGDGTCPECPCDDGECDGTGPGPGDGTCPNCPSEDCDCDGDGSGQTDPSGNKP